MAWLLEDRASSLSLPPLPAAQVSPLHGHRLWCGVLES